MQAWLASKISDHLALTPEKYLLCRNVTLCRAGKQIYAGSEIGVSENRVTVHRSPEEVQDPAHIASLEGKCVVSPHPGSFLTSTNTSYLAKGHGQHIRPSTLVDGTACLLGDLLITDQTLIEQILSGALREISIGYDTVYVPRSDGTYEQTELRANHIAVVTEARANQGRPQSDVRIMDGANLSLSPAAEFAAETRQFHRQPIGTVNLVPITNHDHEVIMEEFSEQEIVAALRELARINRMLSSSRATPTQDRDYGLEEMLRRINGSPEAVQFADACNALGRKLRGRSDCRPGLRERAEDAARNPDTDFAEQARQFHRREF
jgi:hypothetical protein